MRLLVLVRKCFCKEPTCQRKVFAERLTPFVAPWARVTARLFQIVQTLGLATGGRLGARVTDRLSIQTSKTTILRRIMALPPEPIGPVSYLGIDDFHFDVDAHSERFLWICKRIRFSTSSQIGRLILQPPGWQRTQKLSW